MTYELWDATSANRLGEFSTLYDAVEGAREIVELDGVEVANDLFVEAVSGATTEVVLTGTQLVGYFRERRREYA
jgi:hypothetical protein